MIMEPIGPDLIMEPIGPDLLVLQLGNFGNGGTVAFLLTLRLVAYRS